MSAAANQPPPWQTDHYAIIPQPGEPRALLLADAAGWSLPHLRLDTRRWLTEVGHLRPALLALLGVDATALRYVYARTDQAREQTAVIYEMENHSPAWVPPANGLWVGRAELERLTLSQPEQQAALADWLADLESGARSEQRPPWSRPGWLAAATAWLHEQLAPLDRPPIAAIEQVKSWGISCVLRARTADGDAYLKAVPALFAQEPVVTQALALRYPANIPTPIAIDRERSWMLLWDFGHGLRDNTDIAIWDADIAIWEESLRQFSQMQRDSAGHVEELFADGCVDRRLEVLAAQIDPLLSDTDGLVGLAPDEIARLHALAPHLKASCAKLAGYDVPHALVHGDFHPGNIAFQAGRPIFFDWTDACIAHPFLDMITVLDAAEALGHVPDARARLREVYLTAWAAYEPPARLAEAFELGLTLGALHQAISYRAIVATLEPVARHELDWGVPYWLRLVLSREVGGS
jgi:hypothetical protein